MATTIPPVPSASGFKTSAGALSDQAYSWLQQFQSATRNALANITTLQGQTYGETFAIGGSLSNQDYNVLLAAPFGFKISNIRSKCRSGTATATFKIAGVALGGTANSVSSSAQDQAKSSANVVAVGNDVTCTISANAACIDAAFTITYTRV